MKQIHAVENIAQIEPYIPGKSIDTLEREYGVKNAIKVASNENPLGPSSKVLAHLKDLLLNPLEFSRYPDGNGFKLKSKLAETLSTEHLSIGIEQITLGNGSNDVLDLLARTFAGKDDEIIYSQYAFAVYALATQACGATAVVTEALDWGHDLQAMMDAITHETRLIYIANPNNPTGTCLSESELFNFLQRVPENIIVVVDEAYKEYASSSFDGYHTMLPELKQFENLVISRTFSKAYGLASFRIGYVVSSVTIAELLNRVRQPFNNNGLALETAVVALDDQTHIRQSVTLNDQGMTHLIQGFDTLGLSYIPSAGNFVCVNIGEKCPQVYESLLREGVITRPTANYQMPDYLRISIGTMEENIRVMTALKKVLSILNWQVP